MRGVIHWWGMKTYAIAVYYRFDSGYLERYDSLLQSIAAYPDVWMETPSMFILRTDDDIGVVEGRVRASGFRPDTDILLVIDVTGQEAIFAGKIENMQRLNVMFPAQENAPSADARTPCATSSLKEWRALASGKPIHAGFLTTPQPQFGFKGFRRPQHR